MSKSVESLVKIIKGLPVIKQRAISAIVGATVADAASRPLHWIYNQTKLDELLEATTPEFYPSNQCPFYSRPLGERSCYNDIMYVTLKYLHDNNSVINNDVLYEAIHSYFGEGTPYMDAYSKRQMAYDSENKGSFKGPVEGPWIQGGILKFFDNFKNKSFPYGDSSNTDNDGYFLAVPLIVMNASISGSNPDWSTVSSIASTLTTHSDTMKLFQLMANMLSNFVTATADPFKSLKDDASTIYPEILNQLGDIEDKANEPFVSVVLKHGKACSLPGSFLGAYTSMLRTDSFVDAVRLNITAGGCNCSRSNIIGSCFGAKYGIDGIPIEWMKKTKDIENIMEMAIEVMSK